MSDSYVGEQAEIPEHVMCDSCDDGTNVMEHLGFVQFSKLGNRVIIAICRSCMSSMTAAETIDIKLRAKDLAERGA